MPAGLTLDQLLDSGLFNAEWYLARYPDVAQVKIDPARHYLTIGTFLARDPGPTFSTRYYLAQNPDVAQAGIDPVLHYLTAGRAEGRLPHPPPCPPVRVPAQAALSHWRHLLETGGLDAGPLEALERLARTDPPNGLAHTAAECLALWALRQEGKEAGKTALGWLEQVLQRADIPAQARLAPLRTIALKQSGAQDLAEEALVKGEHDCHMAGLDPGGLYLAATRIRTSEAARLACLNRALEHHGLTPATLAPGPGPAFGRLESKARQPVGTDGPLISVLMAAHNAADTIAPAMRAITSQSWQSLELIVIDDASSDDTPRLVTEAATKDPRIRLIRQAQNGGAYQARNTGLAAARGDFITLHDADDWAHCERLERQVGLLLDNPGFAGSMSLQARCTDQMELSRWTGTGEMLFENLSSLMLPARLIRGCLGNWDRVKVSADSELLRRVRHLFGAQSVFVLPQAPLALQLDDTGNATADQHTGMGWFYYGARREYYEAQRHYHASGGSLYYLAHGPRPFPAPEILKPGTDPATEQVFDHVYSGIFSGMDAGLKTLLSWLEADLALGHKVGLVPLYDMSIPAGGGLSIHPKLRALIDEEHIRVLCYGETARCTRFRRLPGQISEAPQRYVPHLYEGDRKVLTPASVPQR